MRFSEQKRDFSKVLGLLNLLGARNLSVVTGIKAPKCLNVVGWVFFLL